PLAQVRQRTLDQLALLPAGVKRFVNPQRYAVGFEKGLFNLRQNMILKAKGIAAEETAPPRPLMTEPIVEKAASEPERRPVRSNGNGHVGRSGIERSAP